jgi:hypothetical protein
LAQAAPLHRGGEALAELGRALALVDNISHVVTVITYVENC